MSIADLIKKAENAIVQGDNPTALDLLNKALSENPSSIKCYLLRSNIQHTANKVDLGLQDAEYALKLSIDSGKRENMGLAYLEISMIYYKVKLYHKAEEFIKKSEEYSTPGDANINIWKSMIAKKIERSSSSSTASSTTTQITTEKTVPKAPETTTTTTTAVKSVDPIAINVAPSPSTTTAPPKQLRTDWFDSKSLVNISLFVKNIPKDSLTVEFKPLSVKVDSELLHYTLDPLFGEIDVAQSSYRVFGTKLELYLHKKDESVKWTQLESRQPENTSGTTIRTSTIPSSPEPTQVVKSYPSSSKKHIDWELLDKELADDLESDAKEHEDPNDFFKQIYASADDDAKRAMMKSYIESNGTSLSTDWSDVSKGKVETSPPEGMKAVKY